MIEKIQLKNILRSIPKTPGIYKMLDKNGRVIYVGKARQINKRVRQYFQKDYMHSTRTRKMLENLANIETIATDSELEAILLETNLIKQLQPKYNILMKDDKNYVYIRITKNEDFPRIQIVRKVLNDGAKYIGPKTSAHKVKETFKILKKIFPFRHCGLDIGLLEKRKFPEKHAVKVTRKVLKYPCLDYYIKRCIAPCIGNCNIEEYRQIIKNVENFLEGKADDILNDLRKQMQTYAQNHEFEKAARLRDKLKKVEEILEKQKISDPNRKDTDIINYATISDNAYFNLFQIRNGKLIGQENFILQLRTAGGGEQPSPSEQSEVLESFMEQYYEIAADIPQEILIPHATENNLEEFMKTKAQKKVKIIVPRRGEKNKLLELSLKNAEIYADRNRPKWEDQKSAIASIAEILQLPSAPKRIECYDISHLSGTETVGSMIVFENGSAKNSHYRKFHLRTVQNKPDDYKSLEEVIYRRFSKLTSENLPAGFKFKRAAKKHHEFIKQHTPKDFICTDRQFYVLEKNMEPQKIDSMHGFIAIKEYPGKFSEISNLWGYKLIKEAIKKTKGNRVYIACTEELRDYCSMIGFEEIKKLPPGIRDMLKNSRSQRNFQDLSENDEARGGISEKIRRREVNHLQPNPENCSRSGVFQRVLRTTYPITMAYDKNKHKIDESFSKKPDLIIIDGGKGQLSAADKILKELNLDIPRISLAKKLEEIFFPNRQNSLILDRTSPALKLLQHARDEAHRFAITYNRNRRSKAYKKP
ncbi:excinuclease ABC subunit UvrC [Candidatus Peregrinibacteria bacterium]|nr:excinuclease ABC subunit UvrC [Candidatus Peregrinibacteria bacterium]